MQMGCVTLIVVQTYNLLMYKKLYRIKICAPAGLRAIDPAEKHRKSHQNLQIITKKKVNLRSRSYSPGQSKNEDFLRDFFYPGTVKL